jgi:type IV/VI secretion system ImpK/VasF family protein
VPTILQHFAGVFSYGLALDEELSQEGQSRRGPDQLYGELHRRVEEARNAALQDQKRKEDVNEATFAMVAWLDEIVARHPAFWEAATSLQVRLFDTTNAGNEFFSHLSALGPQQDEAREVYYVALCLGFVGQYYYEVGDQGELGRLKEMHVRHLPAAAALLQTLADEKVTAQPYRVADPPGPRLPSRWPERVAKAGIAVALVTVAGILAYYLWPRGPIGPDPEQVAKVLEKYACHDFRMTEQPSARLEISGHMRGPSERERLTKELRALRGGDQITLKVETLSEPFCEVVGLVAPLRRANQEGAGGLKIATRNGNTRLVEDEVIALDASLPESPTCLYVDYFVADATTVVHLAAPEDGERACRSGSGTVPIGDAKPGQPPWKVSPPFGREMVLAIASPAPLFARPRDGIESPREYLDALRKAIDGSGDDLVADYMLVTTEKK